MTTLRFKDIQKNDGYVKIPESDFNALLEAIEDGMDLADLREAREDNQEAFPLDLFESIDNGENPMRAFRQYRGMTQAELASLAGIKQNMISSIENGTRDGTITVLVKIANALNVDIDMLVDID